MVGVEFDGRNRRDGALTVNISGFTTIFVGQGDPSWRKEDAQVCISAKTEYVTSSFAGFQLPTAWVITGLKGDG